MEKPINLSLSYKEACIIKDALRDKHRNADEEAIYKNICNAIEQFKATYNAEDTCLCFYK